MVAQLYTHVVRALCLLSFVIGVNREDIVCGATAERVVPQQEAQKIGNILKKSNLRQVTLGGKGVINAGFVAGYDPRGGPDISITYEHTGSASDADTNTMLTKYENALKGISYRMERHDKGHSCPIPGAHVHVYLA